MKISYLVQRLPKKYGLGDKLNSQIAFMQELGLDAHLVVVGDASMQSSLYPDLEKITIQDNLLNQITRYYIIYRILCKLINLQQKNDIIYIRSLPPNPFTWIALYLPRRSKIIIEYQTIEPYETKLSSQKNRIFLIDFLFGTLSRKKIDAIVGVTDEITQYELKRTGDPKKPHITIGNGFDVKSVPSRNPRPFNHPELHLLCVANIRKWHGLDRLLKGMTTYSGSTRTILHIAGDGAEIPLLKQLVEKLNLQNRVIFHGFKTGEDLDTLFNSCHIAVGSLGIHRIGLNEASILKAREYCARGIPYIIACADPDFPDDFPYIHMVSPDESPVDIEKIIEFTQTVCADLDHPKKMRAYALTHLDWSVKMKKLKAFLETLVSEPKSIA